MVNLVFRTFQALLPAILMAFFWSTAAAEVADITLLAGDTPHIALTGRMTVLIDPGGSLGVAEVVARKREFAPLAANRSLGFTSAAAWFRVEVRRTVEAPAEWLLSVYPAFLDQVDIYVVGADGRTELHAVNGRLLPFATRELSNRLPVFRLDFPDEAPRTLYFRVTSKSALLLLPELWQPAAFAQAASSDSHLYGIHFGIFAALALVGLLFWVRTREPLYLAVGITITLHGAYQYVVNGFAYQYLFGDLPLFNARLLGILICAAATSFIWTIPVLLGITRREYPRLWLMYSVVAALCAAATLLAVLGYYHLVAPVLPPIMLMLPPVSLVVIWRKLWQPGATRTYYVPALLLAMISQTGLIFGILGVLPLSQTLNTVWQISALVEMVLFALGIADRYRQSEEAKKAAQAEALASSRQAERELEGKVAERTLALAETNEKLHRVAEERRVALDTASDALAAERAMMDAQRQFVTMVSHEFRTPLSIIDASNQSLRVLIDRSDVEATKRVDKIAQAMERLKTLIDHTLSRERLEAGRLTAHPSPFDLPAWLTEQARVARVMAPLHQVTLTLSDELAEKLLMVSGDSHLLSVAWMNLVDNAAKFSPPGGPIRLGARLDGEALMLEVSDAGPGIPAANLPTLFDKFVRGSHVQGIVGAGLGLYMVRRIAELHDGETSVINTDPGCRAILRLKLEGLRQPPRQSPT